VKKPYSKFHEYLVEIKFSYENNRNINKVSRGVWSFIVGNDEYIFRASPSYMVNGKKDFILEWGRKTPEGLSTEIVGDKKDKIMVFRNVLSCIASFIEDEKPEIFSMYVGDKLIKIYDAMWAGHYKDKPFNKYIKDEDKHKLLNGNMVYIHYFTRKENMYVSEDVKDVMNRYIYDNIR